MNIHYDVTGLLTVVWRSHSGQIVWHWIDEDGPAQFHLEI